MRRPRRDICRFNGSVVLGRCWGWPRPEDTECIQRTHATGASSRSELTQKSLTSSSSPIYVRPVQASQRYLHGGGCSLTWSSGVCVTERHDTATTCALSCAHGPG